MEKFKFKQDYVAKPFFSDRPLPNAKSFSFKKGDVVEATVQQDFANQNHIVATANGMGSTKEDTVTTKKDVQVSSAASNKQIVKKIAIVVAAGAVIYFTLRALKVIK